MVLGPRVEFQRVEREEERFFGQKLRIPDNSRVRTKVRINSDWNLTWFFQEIKEIIEKSLNLYLFRLRSNNLFLGQEMSFLAIIFEQTIEYCVYRLRNSS